MTARGGQTVDIGRGKQAEFVRWVAHSEGWKPESVKGRFIRLTKAGWLVLVDGQELELERGIWDWCAE